MEKGFVLQSVPIACVTGIYADAKTGRRLIFKQKSGYFIPDPKKKSPVNKKTKMPVLAETYAVERQRLVYRVYQGMKINRSGLCFEPEPVFTASISRSGTVKACGEKNLSYWLNDANVNREVLVAEKNSISVDPLCRTVFHCPAKSLIAPSDDQTVLTILKMAANGSLAKKIDRLNDLTNQRFGIELEFTGISRSAACQVLGTYFNATPHLAGSIYDKYTVLDSKGRVWTIMRDGSIHTYCGRVPVNDTVYSCELVTPILEYGDIKTVLQPIIRLLRRAGATVNSSCGIHVHVAVTGHTPQSLRHLSNFMASHEQLLFKALAVKPERLRWCGYASADYLHRLNAIPSKELSVAAISRAWYGGNSRSHIHYDGSRYTALNLHSMFQKKGLEFRCFNSTLHAGKVRGYIELCLAMSQHAKMMTRSSYNVRRSANDLAALRNFFACVGLTGEQFKTCRLHLTRNMKKEQNARQAA